ncbi:MAG: cell division protein ZapB [Vicinamibacterales bacterium]|nr:cell division protein ZapB [Vicinamibacterales bacterium]
MARTGQAVEFEAFDRLEDKVKLLVALVGRMRTEQARMAEETARLTRELEAATARLHDVESVSVQVTSLKDEREVIRTRVSSLLEQLESLNI